MNHFSNKSRVVVAVDLSFETGYPCVLVLSGVPFTTFLSWERPCSCSSQGGDAHGGVGEEASGPACSCAPARRASAGEERAFSVGPYRHEGW